MLIFSRGASRLPLSITVASIWCTVFLARLKIVSWNEALFLGCWPAVIRGSQFQPIHHRVHGAIHDAAFPSTTELAYFPGAFQPEKGVGFIENHALWVWEAEAPAPRRHRTGSFGKLTLFQFVCLWHCALFSISGSFLAFCSWLKRDQIWRKWRSSTTSTRIKRWKSCSASRRWIQTPVWCSGRLIDWLNVCYWLIDWSIDWLIDWLDDWLSFWCNLFF